MTSQATTLGDFIAELMEQKDHSNRSLASAAKVSEGAIRNLLKYGRESRAKDPDARTLTNIAKALDVDALRLFRLAGYIPPAPAAHSLRADHLAGLFDQLPTEKQDAVLGVLEAMMDTPEKKQAVQEFRDNPQKVLLGINMETPRLLSDLANHLIIQLDIVDAYAVRREIVDPESVLLTYRWKDLPRPIQERVIALVQHKLSLEYDPTMVDQEWRN